MAGDLIPSVGGHPILVYFYDGSDWRPALLDTFGHLQIDVLSSALPAGAATDTVLQAVGDRIGALTSPASGSVNKLLTDALTALQLIDNLQAALESVATDRLQVRGEDQLFSLKDNLLLTYTYTMPGDGNYSHDTGTVPAGEFWVVTNIYGSNDTTVATRVVASVVSGGTTHTLKQVASPVVREGISWQGKVVLKEDDKIRVRWIGNANGDGVSLTIVGYPMTAES